MEITELRSNDELPVEFSRRCPRDHAHYQLRGATSDGRRATALSGVYPKALCEEVLRFVAQPRVTTSEGRVHLKAEDTAAYLRGASKKIETTRALEQHLVVTLMLELQVHAKKQGLTQAWNNIVLPWAMGSP